jgi:hypothetical protein
MNNEQKRLETILLECIEEEAKKTTAERFDSIPQLAHELIELWRVTCV